MDTLAKTVRLAPDLEERLRRVAFDRRISQADIIRKAIEEYLDQLDCETK